MPDHTQLHSWVSIQLHCSGCTVSRVGCIGVLPPAVRRKTDYHFGGLCDSRAEAQATCRLTAGLVASRYRSVSSGVAVWQGGPLPWHTVPSAMQPTSVEAKCAPGASERACSTSHWTGSLHPV